MKRTAVLIDGGYFIRRIEHIKRKHFKGLDLNLTSQQLLKIIWRLVKYHIEVPHGSHADREPLELYRIYYYDCPPLDKQVRYPIKPQGHTSAPNKNFKQDPGSILRSELHEELRKNRKTALRMGVLSSHAKWQLNDYALKDLLDGKRNWDSLTNDDFHYEYKQKAVDIKLGMDITILSHEKQVDVIVLVAGDADFVPAAKHARIKGVDFILDPLDQDIPPTLSEHVDGVQSPNIVLAISMACQVEPTFKPDGWDDMIDRRKRNKLQRQTEKAANESAINNPRRPARRPRRKKTA
ncbi:NYN domain-containing protein [Cronobacter sp. HA18006]|uniref:NYN domain-containing protein n=1 Tax=Cronobacter sp. HA18006 TaxID=2715229 RepID=UPI000CFBB13E|nr:NYN domain-containing protein [Cronobacter sp. HA18006]ELY4627309.1 NYN domain-containing protein [Cronobacter sakazakii]NHW97023.1 NYN domain-containing protein [Cronobacter sp. HA18006]